jgi:transcriptional regulator with XRE-family HTH domain
MSNIDELFEASGLSIDDLADRSGLTVARLEAIITGRWTPPVRRTAADSPKHSAVM